MAMPVYLITGVQAAGRSTVAALGAGEEAWRRLAPRHRLAADTARTYRGAGFTVVVRGVVLGEHVPAMATAIGEPVHVVVLDPEPEVVAAREAARPKDGGDAWTVATLVDGLRRATP